MAKIRKPEIRKNKTREKLMPFHQPKFINGWLDIYRTGGFTKLIREKGWAVLVTFFLFYLIRDSILYIFIPFLVYSNFSTCF